MGATTDSIRDTEINRRLLRAGPVPLRRQIAAGIGSEILEGRVPAGVRLPSIRSLALRLGVHRHTTAAAYAELEERGLVLRRAGSGVYVRELGWRPRPNGDLPGRSSACPAPPRHAGGAPPDFRAFVRAERLAGHTATGVLEGLRRWAGGAGSRRVAVVDTDPVLLRLLRAELRARLPGAIVAIVRSALVRRNPRLLDGWLVAALPARVQGLERSLSPWTEIWPLPAAPAAPLRAAVERLRLPCCVGILSASPTVRGWLRELVGRVHGDDAGIAIAASSDASAAERAVRVADLVLADLVALRECTALLAPLRMERRLLRLQLVAPEWAAEVARYLGIETDGGGTTDARTGRRFARDGRIAGALPRSVGGVERHPVHDGHSHRAPGKP